MGGATRKTVVGAAPCAISIHAPRGGSDYRLSSSSVHLLISIHAPRGGSDFELFQPFRVLGKFQSTLPVGGATPACLRPCLRPTIFQSTLPVGGATSYGALPVIPLSAFQSTLPVGGATWQHRPGGPFCLHFNPRSPWGERPARSVKTSSVTVFQSTLPVGGATQTRGPMGAHGEVSIHAPRGGSDDAPFRFFIVRNAISIHAPRGGSDRSKNKMRKVIANFNPRSPWGERLRLMGWQCFALIFQSTLPVGGATEHPARQALTGEISIHAPRGGSDSR